MMKLNEYLQTVKADLYRHDGAQGVKAFLRNLLYCPGFKYTFWMRTCKFLHGSYLLLLLYVPARIILNHYKFKYQIDIAFNADIGKGFYIGHFSQIFIGEPVKIGKNCNVSQGVTIGGANIGERKGHPKIGDKVYFGPGSKVFGKIIIENEVAVGANTVVSKNIPEKSVVMGNPGRVINREGVEGIINFTC